MVQFSGSYNSPSYIIAPKRYGANVSSSTGYQHTRYLATMPAFDQVHFETIQCEIEHAETPSTPTGNIAQEFAGGMFDLSKRVVTKFAEINAHGPILNVPRVSSIDDWNVEFCFPKKGQLKTINGEITALDHVSVAQIDFTPRNVESTKFGSSLVGTAGTPFIYDGARATELGFYVYPELRSSGSALTDNWQSLVAVSGGQIPAGTYNYYATYQWTDEQGNECRSAPSVAAQIITTGSASIDVRVPCLTLTNKSNIEIAVWRTVSSGTTAFMVTSGSVPLYNRFDMPYVVWRDDQKDSTIESAEILYTEGGELPNIAPPISNIIHTHRNRVWAVDENDETTLWFSKTLTDGLGPEFSDAQIILIPREGGPVTALASLAHLLVIFKQDAVYIVQGDGPDVNGQNGSFSNPELMPIEVGCVNKNSVVQTSQGIFFQARQGIYVLTNDQAVKYIGAPVEDYIGSLTISSAVHVQDLNQIRFASVQGTILVYNYYFDRWSIFQNLPSVSALMHNNRYTILSSSGVARQEISGSFKDDGTAYGLRITTPWINLAGIQGYQRVKKATVLGNYRSAHQLAMTASFDYDNDVTESALVQPNNFVGGVSSSVYQFSHQLSRQKCQSVKFSFEDLAQSGSGESYTLEALDLRVGVREKANRLPAARQI